MTTDPSGPGAPWLDSARALQATLRSHLDEILWFVRARSRAVDAGVRLRKRAHHLDKLLLHPRAYSDELHQRIVSELGEALSRHRSEFPGDPTVGWADALLAEEAGAGREAPSTDPPGLDGTDPHSPVSHQSLMRLLEARRSRREFASEPLSSADRQAIVRAGLAAPSSCNRQPLSFLFVDDEAGRQLVASTVRGGREFFGSAPTALLVLCYGLDYRHPSDRFLPWIDGALAVQNILLICEARSIACCLGHYASFGAVTRERDVRRALSIPDDHLITASVAMGRGAPPVPVVPRVSVPARLHQDRFGFEPVGEDE